jgi:hypothetical protein
MARHRSSLFTSKKIDFGYYSRNIAKYFASIHPRSSFWAPMRLPGLRSTLNFATWNPDASFISLKTNVLLIASFLDTPKFLAYKQTTRGAQLLRLKYLSRTRNDVPGSPASGLPPSVGQPAIDVSLRLAAHRQSAHRPVSAYVGRYSNRFHDQTGWPCFPKFSASLRMSAG